MTPYNKFVRITYIFIALFLGACSSAKKYEKIIDDVLEDYQTDSITYHANSWRPFSSPKNAEISNEVKKQSGIDFNLCIDEYRGQLFKSETNAVLFFMQCMNKKGWRLQTEEVFLISH